MTESSRCPVCRASFRESRLCSRCGADLEILMRLAVSAWQLRDNARSALAAGEFARARDLAAVSAQLQFTESAESLRLLSDWLLQRM